MAGIFISYRRSDSAGHSGRLADDLGEALVGPALFRDIEAIEAGEDFVDALARAVGECAVMLVVIGPAWAKVTTADGQRRLHQSGDFVRREVEAALARDVRVIPVLVHDAQMPDAADLPESLQPLLRRNAYSISDRRWKYDIEQLIDILIKIPGVERRMPAAPPPPPPPMHAPTPTYAPARAVAPATAMPMWGKIVLGLVAAFFALGLVGIFLESSESGAPTAATSSAAIDATPAAQVSAEPHADASIVARIEGLWQTEDGLYYRFVRKGDGLRVLSGENVEAPLPADADASAHIDAPFAGDAQLDGRAFEVILTNRVSGDTELLQVRLSDDDTILQGQLQGTPVTLQRR